MGSVLSSALAGRTDHRVFYPRPRVAPARVAGFHGCTGPVQLFLIAFRPLTTATMGLEFSPYENRPLQLDFTHLGTEPFADRVAVHPYLQQCEKSGSILFRRSVDRPSWC